MSEWIDVPTLDKVGRYPNFIEYGFHTGRKVKVRFNDGTEEETIYQGYGMFGNDCREDVTSWMPLPEAPK